MDDNCSYTTAKRKEHHRHEVGTNGTIGTYNTQSEQSNSIQSTIGTTETTKEFFFPATATRVFSTDKEADTYNGSF